jgi:NAD(P)H-flavin reductase
MLFSISKTKESERLTLQNYAIQPQQPIRAGQAILNIHHFMIKALPQLNKNKIKARLTSLFDFNFIQNIPWINQFKSIKSDHSTCVNKISNLDKKSARVNPLQDFINSLSTKKKEPISQTQAINQIEKKELVSKQFSAPIIEVIQENAEFKTLRLKRPKDWDFQPGQYLEIRGEDSSKPAILAIASGVSKDYIEITARPNENPAHANYCLNRKPGEELLITGPLGSSFPLDLIALNTPVLLIGGGSGLTALRSLLQSLPQTETKIIYSTTTREKLLYHEQIEQWKLEGHTISLTQEKENGFAQGRVSEHLKDYNLKSDTMIFICGPKDLVLDTAKLLISRGVSPERIYGSLPSTAKETRSCLSSRPSKNDDLKKTWIYFAKLGYVLILN